MRVKSPFSQSALFGFIRAIPSFRAHIVSIAFFSPLRRSPAFMTGKSSIFASIPMNLFGLSL
jgi:hypothetical protein